MADRIDIGGFGDLQAAGGAGNDTYVVDSPGDSLIENAGAGTDTVESLASWTLAANFENLSLVGFGEHAATGNAVANVLTGNAYNNVLAGLGGNDTLDGGGGMRQRFLRKRRERSDDRPAHRRPAGGGTRRRRHADRCRGCDRHRLMPTR